MTLDNLKEYMVQELGFINKALSQNLNLLPEPCKPVALHIINAGGKRLRPLLTVIFCRLFGSDSSEIYKLSTSMELLHAATLIHDDILDNAANRRGKAAAHILFGVPKSILAGDAMLALGNSITANYDIPQLTTCYSTATMQTAAGEILEMESLNQPELTFSEYLKIAQGKTACLIAQACALGACFAKANRDDIDKALAYGENLGLAFQLVDDALDFAPESQTGKPSGGDLREGKMTLPISLYRQSLKSETRDIFDKKFKEGKFSTEDCKTMIEKIWPFAKKSLIYADECLEKAKEAALKMPNRSEQKILLEITDYVRNRRT